mgnify:CR=1 FL=1
MVKRTVVCAECNRVFGSLRAIEIHRGMKHKKEVSDLEPDIASGPDWEGECEVCGSIPTVPEIGLCGPCAIG